MVIWVWLARLNIAPISKKPLLQLNFQMSKVFFHHPTMTNIPILKSLLGSCSWQSLIFRIPDNWHSFLGGFKYFLFLPLLGNDQPVFVWGFWGELGQNRKYVKISFDFTQIHSFQPFQPYFSLGHPNLATGGVSRGLPMPKAAGGLYFFWGGGIFVTQRWIQLVLQLAGLCVMVGECSNKWPIFLLNDEQRVAVSWGLSTQAVSTWSVPLSLLPNLSLQHTWALTLSIY